MAFVGRGKFITTWSYTRRGMISLGIVTTSGEWAGLAEENYANNKVSVAKKRIQNNSGIRWANVQVISCEDGMNQ